MKLRSLHIAQYRTLQDVTIEFPDPQDLGVGLRLPPVHLLLGVNGTGKTAVLRSLAHIFAALDDRRAPDIPFEIRYQVMRGEKPIEVHIQGDGRGALSGVTFQIREKDSLREVNPGDWDGYLPDQIVVYTSGSPDEWRFLEPDARDTRNAEKEWLELVEEDPSAATEVTGPAALLEPPAATDGEVVPPRTRLFGDRDLTLALLATLAIDEEHPLRQRDDLYRRAGIASLRAFSLRLEPLATRSLENVIRERLELEINALLEERLEEDPALARKLRERLAWQPPELPAQLLDRVRKLATLASHRHRNPDGSYHLYFEMDGETRLALGGTQGMFATARQFFDFLADLQTRGVLAQADLLLGRSEDDTLEPVLGCHLSDGEHEFLGRMALFLLMRQPNALFLLDEPETHFNDVWKRELVDLLADVLEGHHTTVLLSTHSSIVISDIAHPQMVLLVKDERGYTRPLNIRTPTFGADPSDIAVAVLGAGGSGGALADEELDAALKRGDREELKRLLAIVSPGYWRFRIRSRLEELDATSDQTA